jgi:hypothetical protein
MLTPESEIHVLACTHVHEARLRERESSRMPAFSNTSNLSSKREFYSSVQGVDDPIDLEAPAGVPDRNNDTDHPYRSSPVVVG